MPASFSGVDYEENELPRQDGKVSNQKPTRSKTKVVALLSICVFVLDSASQHVQYFLIEPTFFCY